MSDTDANDFIYCERTQGDLIKEVWDTAVEDVHQDFPQDQSHIPSVDVFTEFKGNCTWKCKSYHSLDADLLVPLVIILFFV